MLNKGDQALNGGLDTPAMPVDDPLLRRLQAYHGLLEDSLKAESVCVISAFGGQVSKVSAVFPRRTTWSNIARW